MPRPAPIARALVASLILTYAPFASAQPTASDQFVSEASRIVGTYEPKSREHTPQAMAEAAQRFLETLDDAQRQQAALTLDDPERREWTNLPARSDAGGLQLGKCNQQQVEAACDLMGTLFSKQGYAKMCHIMLADDQLLKGGRARSGFGTEEFAVVIFGTPSPDTPWAFQLDGHHVGVNLAIEGKKLTMSPSFIGTQPEAYHLADKKIRPFERETDGATELINSLDPKLQAQAIVKPKRGRIKTGPGTDGKVPEAAGVSCADFSDAQKEALMKLIAQWVNDLPPEQAELRMEQLRKEIDQMHFAWHGPTAAGSDVSYAIQGPTLIIEYACQNLGDKPTDHLHSMYRDPTNEYGKQLK
ncbi:DUF3500 domain-containing protein [Adhaeretor mobilis]|uniref:DUF3500 domain-containing protein n=1 Tax=Adhaeretor mobilis TaxID=1930276 RepID=A0A517N117_9BACT|nr:DUF3500 domain-containing protein [Adhaeretor mobilis]QDT00831.1 hypothetical protein HG15A2_41730 [Adhaeretor mobilis]